MDEPMPPRSVAGGATRTTSVGIELLASWIEPDDKAPQRAAERIAHLLHEEGEDPISLIAGLPNLSELLVLHLAKERGATGADMRDRAAEILRDWSPRSRRAVAPVSSDASERRVGPERG